MSKSFKKTKYCGDKKSALGKRQSNKRVRKFQKELSNGSAFKKLYCSYNICDWYSLKPSLSRYLKNGKCASFSHNTGEYNEKEEISTFLKYYHRK